MKNLNFLLESLIKIYFKFLLMYLLRVKTIVIFDTLSACDLNNGLLRGGLDRDLRCSYHRQRQLAVAVYGQA